MDKISSSERLMCSKKEKKTEVHFINLNEYSQFDPTVKIFHDVGSIYTHNRAGHLKQLHGLHAK